MAVPPKHPHLPAGTRPGRLDARRLLRQRESLRAVIEAVSSELDLEPLLTSIVRHACALLEVPCGSIGLHDEGTGVIRIAATHGLSADKLGASFPPGVGVAGRILLDRRPLVVERYGSLPESPWTDMPDHAVVGVPILWGERLVGFFGVGAPPPRRFDTEEVETLALFGRHAAIAIENASRYEREQRRARRLALAARVGQIVTSGLDLEDLLQRAADAIHEVLGYPNVDIPLIPVDEPGVLVVRTRGGHYKKAISGVDRIPVERGIMGTAARERRTLLVNDVASDLRYVRPPAAEVEVRAELAVPILLGDQVLGVLNVESEAPFEEDDATSLQVVADHLAVAVRNARLHEQARQVAVLEERQRLSRDLHDSVTQLLFSLTLIAQTAASAWKRDPAEGERHVERLVELARSALGEMRALVLELHPLEREADATGAGRIRREGLPAALRRHAAEVAGDALQVELDAEGYEAQPLEREEALYGVAEESLDNALEHARARKVSMALRSDGEHLILTVSDDGDGFDPDRLRPSGRKSPGRGLASLRERVESLGGRLRVHSSPGKGTTVEAQIPRRRA